MEVAGELATAAGMLAMWAPRSFESVVDYETWESVLLEDEDIRAQVLAGAFVPVNIGADGAFGITARVDSISAPAVLTDRERQHLLVSSAPYLFVSTGEAVISGVEHVRGVPYLGLKAPVPAGRWQVTVNLIDWQAEPGCRDEAGKPAPNALSDFVLLINPERGADTQYRTQIQTFDRATSRDQRLQLGAERKALPISRTKGL
ncbi:hypothetical protein I6A60_40195 [Frankia sp. AgB1.9]|uniref:hypothetical protein n=1 Tax=unclassified Frankia TaxID=2632575 RepID=UPI001934180B|nr:MULTISPECIES: hypothetical protein [unclassified Frankia]MBL7490419.1 hypothetical protein [Frankia sp. AgW1.1]MBL7554006.1 hypothetical protein [Frankia sp. AgB1.9]MBL7624634.1 hypothetical protein [Frankia sp. AgB1.8]